MAIDFGVRRIAAAFLILGALPTALMARGAGEDDGTLTIGAIQFAVSEEVYASPESFRRAVDAALDRMESEASAYGYFPDLAVFPEYTSAFLGLSDMDDRDIASLAADPPAHRKRIIEAILATHWMMMDLWADVSRERGYAILPGSALVIDSAGRLHNRAYVFSRDGEIIWTQDKVFLGAPEKALLDMDAGRLNDAEPFTIDGFQIVATICRDTYNDEWETILPDADIWIDIKANELPYTQEYYDEALKSRLPGSPVDRGLTVSLSGEILGFRFTGPTEYLYDMGPVAGTDPYEKNAVLVIQMPRE